MFDWLYIERDELEIERLKCVALGVKLGSLETNACTPELSSHMVVMGPTCPITSPEDEPRPESSWVCAPLVSEGVN